MIYPSDKEAREQMVEIGRRMFERRYVAANDGNISIRVGENRVWVTPAGVSKGYMREDMLICLDMDGNVLEGSMKPSSEAGMHLRVYKENPEVGAVVHAHPVTATAFAIARVPLELALMTESVIGLGVVPVADYATTGTAGVAESVAPFCRDYNALLLANHGALTWGRTGIEAYYRMETLECCAQVMEKLGCLSVKPHILSRAQVQELVDIRQRLGVKAGGRPLAAEDIEKG